VKSLEKGALSKGCYSSTATLVHNHNLTSEIHESIQGNDAINTVNIGSGAIIVCSLGSEDGRGRAVDVVSKDGKEDAHE
jgi:hypothetical protein